jgi:hypothetical protein
VAVTLQDFTKVFSCHSLSSVFYISTKPSKLCCFTLTSEPSRHLWAEGLQTRETQPLATLRAFTACTGITLPYLYLTLTSGHSAAKTTVNLLTHELHGTESLRSCQSLRYSRIFQLFMGPKISSPSLQEPSTGPYPEQVQSSPNHPILSL